MKKILILLLILILFAGCTSKIPEGSTLAKVYYTDKTEENLVETEVLLDSESITVAANKLFTELYTPPSKNLSSALPRSVKLIDLSMANDECRLTLSPSYLSLSASRTTALCAALTKTLCSLPEIEKVSIFCEDRAFHFTSDEFVTELPKTFYESHTISLYYPQNNYTSVKKEVATISLADKGNLAETVVSLLQNPTLPSLKSPFPDGCEVYSVKVDNGVCILDVSEEFVSNAIHKKKQETFLLFSIVNTLTELPDIEKVRFLVEGNASYGYIYYNIASPFKNSSNLFPVEK